MKYSEFRQRVIDIGFTVEDKAREVLVVDDGGDIVMSISTDDLFMFDCDWSAFVHLNRDVQEPLFDLAYKLAKTPLAEREEEKLYRVKFPAITRLGRNIYLSKEKGCVDPLGIDWSGETFIHDRPSLYTFTEQEIKDIDERYLAFKVEVTPE